MPPIWYILIFILFGNKISLQLPYGITIDASAGDSGDGKEKNGFPSEAAILGSHFFQHAMRNPGYTRNQFENPEKFLNAMSSMMSPCSVAHLKSFPSVVKFTEEIFNLSKKP